MDRQMTDIPDEVTINGTNYRLATLTAEAQCQLRNLMEVERKIAMAQNEIATMQTWRQVHGTALTAELEKLG